MDDFASKLGRYSNDIPHTGGAVIRPVVLRGDFIVGNDFSSHEDG